jgi:hypothetical protein
MNYMDIDHLRFPFTIDMDLYMPSVTRDCSER